MTVCDAIIVAAGRGTRVGSTTPKQYLPVAGKPLLRWSIEALLAHQGVRNVRAVIAGDDAALFQSAVSGLGLPPAVIGAATRQGSVLAGLEALAADPPDVVAIHDAARPLLPPGSLDEAIALVGGGAASGAVVAVPVADTLKRVEAGAIRDTVPRDGLWRMQTPQVFRYGEILAAHRACAGLAASERTALSDDAAVAERAGLAVMVVPGRESNLKVTNPPDVELAERLLVDPGRQREVRTGFGFDVHAFDEGAEVVLCGVHIPHGFRLSGHSDADVALHALTDAVLGAMAEADIGKHFPPSDARWKGADSATFLRHAVELLTARGGRLVHVDVTIVCEAPRIGPHRDAMRARTAEICGIAVGRVSVKATTTEQLGFTGRREGIAAQAVATIELPAAD